MERHRRIRRRLAIAGLVAVVISVAGSAPAVAAGTLTVSVSGEGYVRGSYGIDCWRYSSGTSSGQCSQHYGDQICDPECHTVQFYAVLLAHDLGPGFTFDHWEGACTGTSDRCDVLMDRDANAIAVYKDIQPPRVSLTTPGGGFVRGTITLAATASDNAGIQRVEFALRGALARTLVAAPFNSTLDTTTVADGPATVVATAFDTTNNKTSASPVDVTIDNTRPTLGVSGPDAQTLPGSSTQTWALTSGDVTSGVASVSCSVVPADQPPSFGACSGGTGSHSVTGMPQGRYTFTARAMDRVGNTYDVTRSFSIDTTAPVPAISSGIADGAVTSATTQTWGFTSDDPAASFKCRVYPAALTPGAYGPCSGASSHTATGFSSGTYTFEVLATDAVGNVSSVMRTFTIDTVGSDTTISAGSAGVGVGGSGGTVPTASGSATARELFVLLAYDYDARKTSTTLLTARLKGLPIGATIKVSCERNCPSKVATKMTARAGTLTLKTLLGKPFKPGTVITVAVSKPGFISLTKTLRIRAGKRPLLRSTQGAR